MKKTKTYRILLVVAVLVMASLACSLFTGSGNNGGSTVDDETEATVDTQSGDSGLTPTSGPEATGPEASGEATGGETGDLSSVETGLDALDSYRMQFSYSVEGTDADGNAQTGTIGILEEIDRANARQHWSYTSSGSAAEDAASFGSFEYYVIDNVTYMRSANEGEEPTCMSFSDSSETSDFSSTFDTSDFLGEIEDAKLVKKGEEVNGVKTDHYTFDQSNIFFGSYSSAEGDYWVAQDGGYLVQLHGVAEGKMNPFGVEIDGKLTWDYSLTDINQDLGITLPAECADQAPSTDIPVPANATEQSTFSGMITFNSPDPVETITDFYRSELPNQGWTAGEESVMDGYASLNFTKDGRTLDIMITSSDGGGCTVMITETK